MYDPPAHSLNNIILSIVHAYSSQPLAVCCAMLLNNPPSRVSSEKHSVRRDLTLPCRHNFAKVTSVAFRHLIVESDHFESKSYALE